MNCFFYKDVFIPVNVNTEKEKKKLFRLCFNPTTMIVKKGGVFVQKCIYVENDEHDCPFGEMMTLDNIKGYEEKCEKSGL